MFDAQGVCRQQPVHKHAAADTGTMRQLVVVCAYRMYGFHQNGDVLGPRVL